jgi:phosphate starvation-inducible PhoH-like protein
MGRKRLNGNGNGNGNGHGLETITEELKPRLSTMNYVERRVRIKCKNEKQKQFINMIDDFQITLCSGPAGCGKSHLSLAKAIEYIQTPDNGYNTLYIITPAVEAEEKLGSLPGTLDEKLGPFLFSTYYLIDKIIGKENREKMVKEGIIQALALGYLRGVNIDNAILVFEEAQNASHKQMKTLLTRIGFNSKFIISGDLKQIDRFRNDEESGLIDAMKRFETFNEMGIFHFLDGDSVRNDIINDILKYY